MRIQSQAIPYLDHDIGKTWNDFGLWHCRWITCQNISSLPVVMAFRRVFRLTKASVIRVFVSADERYELFLNGERVGRGPERGDRDHWFFETYEFALAAGEHRLVARVWALGASAPLAQLTVQPGFILSPEQEEYASVLGTGVADWQGMILSGYRFSPTEIPHFTSVGDNLVLDGSQFAWGYERGEGDHWQAVKTLDPGVNAARHTFELAAHLLTPALLPAMLYDLQKAGKVRFVSKTQSKETRQQVLRTSDCLEHEVPRWQNWVDDGQAIIIPAGESWRVLIDLENYYCMYPRLVVSGGKGGRVRLFWAESLYLDTYAKEKGDRNEVDGKYFIGKGDTFLLDGGDNRHYDTLWWQAGRYIELFVEAGDSTLTLHQVAFYETRYPLESSAIIDSGNEQYNRLIPLAIRALQMCSHETYMDCPYYEQLMYVGDTRLEALVNYQISADDRLPQKALRLFDFSHQPTGLTTSRYPSRQRQIIPPFSLWWVGMVYDHALWRGNADLVRSLMPGVRGVLDAFCNFRNARGLVEGPRGWNFIDWVPGWNWGVPAEADLGMNAIINWQFVWILKQAAELESWLGEPELAARNLRLARELADISQAVFWDEQRGLFADDLAHSHFSEHAQCLALLSGELDTGCAERTAHSLWNAPDLARTTIYFSHYLFETCQKYGRMDILENRLSLWFGHEGLGMKTTLEAPEPSRSDCHAWGAHPIYHYFASFLGIRPARMGYRSVCIRPQLGSLPYARGTVVHPLGEIKIEIHRNHRGYQGMVYLPHGLDGTLETNTSSIRLTSGEQTFSWS